jgi:hypothetical protein
MEHSCLFIILQLAGKGIGLTAPVCLQISSCCAPAAIRLSTNSVPAMQIRPQQHWLAQHLLENPQAIE